MGKSRTARIAELFGVQSKAPNAPASEDDAWEVEKEAKCQDRAERRQARNETKVKRARAAAEQLGKSGLGELDVALLLDELTVDDKIKWFTFVVAVDGKHFAFERMRLRNIGAERRRNSRMKDVRAWIDADGIHLRWGERGGLDLRGGEAHRMDSGTLCVSFLQPELAASKGNNDEADRQHCQVA